MGFELLVALLGATLSSVSGIALNRLRERRRESEPDEPTDELDAKLASIETLSTQLSELSRGITPELEERIATAREATEAAKKTMADADRAAALAALNETQIKALRSEIREELEATLTAKSKVERWFSLSIGFGLGIVASVIGSLVWAWLQTFM